VGGSELSKVVFGGPLQDALRGRAVQDEIREVHIRNCDSKLLASIISSLTPDREGVHEKCIESITLQPTVDGEATRGPPDFFGRVGYPSRSYGTSTSMDSSKFLRGTTWHCRPHA
jgi:hypothetical protein